MRLWIAASMCWLCAATAQAAPPVPVMPIVMDRDSTQQQLSGLSQQLADLQWALTNMGALKSPPIAESLARLRRQVAELQRQVAMAPLAPPPSLTSHVATPLTPPGAPLIDDAALSSLIDTIGNEGFSNGKLTVLQQATHSWSFSVAQLVQIVNQFTFSKDKVRAVELVAPRLTDRQNAFQLYDAFTFSSDKQRVQKILGK